MTRLLFVTDVCPWPATSGGVLRQARLIEALRARNETRVVILDEPPRDQPIPPQTEFIPLRDYQTLPPISPHGWGQRYGVLKGVFHPRPDLFRQHQVRPVGEAFKRLRSLARQYDVCWVSWPFFAETAIDAWPGVRVVADYVDIGALRQGSQLPGKPANLHKLFTLIDTVKLAWHERRVARRAWRHVVCKPEDAKFLRQPRKAFVVPNGTDLCPQLDPADAEPGRLLFVGLMSYLPNIDAVRWFVSEALPLLADLPVCFDVVGRDPPESLLKLADGQRVQIRGFAPDLTEVYRRASVVVAPIRLGSGTKLKVLEALAFGKPLVATGEAVRGVALRPGIDFLQADTSIETAAACRRLITDPDLRAQLGRSGRERVESLYTWDRIGELAQRAITP
jgi:polysaccharide biosynthesis protein PslH